MDGLPLAGLLPMPMLAAQDLIDYKPKFDWDKIITMRHQPSKAAPTFLIFTSPNFLEEEVVKNWKSEQAPPPPGAEYPAAHHLAPHFESAFESLLQTSPCLRRCFSHT